MRKRENDAITSPSLRTKLLCLFLSWYFHRMIRGKGRAREFSGLYVWKSVIEINCMFVGPSFIVEEEFDLISNQKKKELRQPKATKPIAGNKAIKVVVHLFLNSSTLVDSSEYPDPRSVAGKLTDISFHQTLTWSIAQSLVRYHCRPVWITRLGYLLSFFIQW